MSELARAIHDSPYKIVMAVTGGGIGAIHDLLTTPGASRSILEASVPYASAALTNLLGGKPDQFCSSATARAMAMACFQRARNLNGEEELGSLIGVGCTASLASDLPKRGDHRVHAAIQTFAATETASVRLVKGRRTRLEEDRAASELLMHLILSHARKTELDWNTGDPDEVPEFQRYEAPEGWSKLLGRECAWTNSQGDRFGDVLDGQQNRLAIYCGAFHPRHEGHKQIATIGAKRYDRVIHEISIQNVDKPPLDFLEMAARASQFEAGEELIFSRAPTFAEKSKVFPHFTFLVGVDTIYRVAQPTYYGGEKARDLAISEIKEQGCRFLVFGRLLDNQFQEFSASEVTRDLANLCDFVSESEFRNDASSTVIRQANRSD